MGGFAKPEFFVLYQGQRVFKTAAHTADRGKEIENPITE